MLPLPIIPAASLALLALALLMFGAFTQNAKATGWLAGAGIAGTTVLVGILGGHMPLFGTLMGPLLIAAPITTTAQLIMGGLAVLCLPLVAPYLAKHQGHKPEFYVLFTLSLAGMAVLAMATDLLTLYMGLELMSFTLYIQTAFLRDNPESSEAGVKYFVLGSLASGFLLFGTSLIYLTTGTTNFAGLVSAVPNTGLNNPMLLMGLILVTTGLVFKLSVVPFHLWTPDVYEGAPTPVTAVMSALPKVAAFVVLVRFLNGPFTSLTGTWQPLLAGLAVASMALGSITAIVQSNLKRLLAYSTIANVGFMLAGVVAANPAGTSGLLTYLLAYGLTSLALFAAIENDNLTTVKSLAGLGKCRPYTSVALTINLFSLAGVPPFVGFIAKLGVLNAAVQAGYTWLALAGGVFSVVAAVYSLYLIKTMMFDEPGKETPTPQNNVGLETVLILTTLLVILLGLAPSLVTGTTFPASLSLF